MKEGVSRIWQRARNALAVLLWTLTLLVVAVAVNVIGIRFAGGVGGWQEWLQGHSATLLVWRVLLYTGTALGWCWMRSRLRAREPDSLAVQRLWRAEVAAVAAILLLEVGILTSPA